MAEGNFPDVPERLGWLVALAEEQVKLLQRLIEVEQEAVEYAKRRDAESRRNFERARAEQREEARFHRERIEEMRRRERDADEFGDVLAETRAIFLLRRRGYVVHPPLRKAGESTKAEEE